MAVFIRVEGLPIAETVNYYVKLTYNELALDAEKWSVLVTRTPQGAPLFSDGPYETRLEATLAASEFIETLQI